MQQKSQEPAAKHADVLSSAQIGQASTANNGQPADKDVAGGLTSTAVSHADQTVMAFSESPVPVSAACCYELCAGILDKKKTLLEMAQDEVLEECGFRVPQDNFEPITSYQTGIGTSGSRQWLYYAEVRGC